MNQTTTLRATWLIILVVSTAILISCSLFTVSQSVSTQEDVENALFNLVNEERLAAGLSALIRDPVLDEYARQYATSQLSQELRDFINLKYLVCNSWWEDCNSRTAKLKEETASRQAEYCLSEPELRIAIFREDATATGLGVAIAGSKIYFVQVFDILNAIDGDGDAIQLYDNANANDPSWIQLRGFLQNDDTDEYAYQEGSFVCTDYAVMLHNRAEAAGIKSAYVSVDFTVEPGHALNAFQTTDKGLVYIDCTGQGLLKERTGHDSSNTNGSDGHDKVAYLANGNDYGLISLSRAYSFDYEFYEDWLVQWHDYEASVEAYNEEVEAYEELRDGRTEISDPEEFEMLQNWVDEINDTKTQLDLLKRELGNFSWESPGFVTKFYVHW